MFQSEVTDFAKYEVYEIVDDKVHYICLCNTFSDACNIAKMLAYMDKTGDSYFVSNVSIPNTLVPGGGWYYEFFNKEGKVCQRSLE